MGKPLPGDAMEAYSTATALPPLAELDGLLAFIKDGLGLSLPAFRALMLLKLKLDPNKDARWADVNKILASLGKSRQASFPNALRTPDDFDGNLRLALGLKDWVGFFNTLPEVDDVYDLYRLRARPEVVDYFLEANKPFMALVDFVSMMESVNAILKDWRKLYDILRAAGKKKHPGQGGQPIDLIRYDAAKFNTLVKRTLGDVTFPKFATLKTDGFDACCDEVRKLESYFHLSAESFDQIRQTHAKPKAEPWEWELVYGLLEKAHTDKAMKDRHGIKNVAGFTALIRYVLGDPKPGDELPESKDFLTLDAAKDASYIRDQLYLEPANFRYILDTHQLEQQVKGKPSEEEWRKAYQMLALAQARKRGEQKVRVEIWDQVLCSKRSPTVKGDTAWRMFGGADAVPATTGFAIASPLLALAEGARSLKLTLAFAIGQFDETACKAALAGPSPFTFWLSTEQEMLALTPANSPLATVSLTLLPKGASAPYRYLQASIDLDPQFPPVLPCAQGAGIQTPWPVLQMTLNDNDTTHRAFAALTLEKLSLEVKVAGLSKLILQNDDGVLNAKKPFEPFGFQPATGSSLYIAHPELCSKKLDSLTVNIDWLGVPDNLSDYYLGYAGFATPTDPPLSSVADNTRFSAQVRLYDNRSLFPAGSLQLFNADSKDLKKGAAATSVNTLSLTGTANGKSLEASHPGYRQIPIPPNATEALEWNRYWQVELGPLDFQHALYPRAANAYANRKKDGTIPNPFVVNPPYTPKIKRLSVGYTAKLEINPAVANPAQAVTLYHVEPFGYREITIDDQHHWLPQYRDAGELFIGIQGLAPPQTLSLLFQIAEGSADPDLAREPVRWWMLSGNRWESLEQGRLLADGTDGLLNAGIIRFDLPAAQPNTLLPSDRYWLRASIANNSRCLGDLVAVLAQAVEAVFDGQGNSVDQPSHSLPPQTITALAEPNPGIKAIHQAYSSAGGLSPEQPTRFYTRVSERLRHKHRALTAWDYERLVLEGFPGIYKVKCLPAGSSTDPRRAGEIKIIVVPDIRGKLPSDPFGPKVSADRLSEIERHLKRLVSPLARFSVVNPEYVRLRVRLGIRLKTVGNPGFYRQALDQALQRYLAPWAYDESAEIVFGGKINANLIVNFVERLEYVDYVAGIKLFTSLEDQDLPTLADPQFIVAPDSILVPDRGHDIDLISEEVYEDAFFSGINYMKVGLDFAIA